MEQLSATANWLFTNPVGWLVLVVVAVAVAAAAWLARPIVKAYRTKTTPDHPDEAQFATDVDRTEFEPFASVFDAPTKELSLIVPAYNEEERMPIMMREMLEFLADRSYDWEMIIVDDGSKDGTVALGQELTARHGADRIRVLKLHQNHGKGGAVRKGMLRARGRYLLMVDADGATKAYEVDKVMTELQRVERGGHGIAIGSRAHLQEAEEGKAKRTPLRKFLQWGFHTVLNLLVGEHGIKDTQCGFKLFTRATAQQIFPPLHIERWAFDVELVLLASQAKVPMVEVPVDWEEIDGSKLDPAAAAIEMARDLLVIRICYMLGIWKPTDGRRGSSSSSSKKD